MITTSRLIRAGLLLAPFNRAPLKPFALFFPHYIPTPTQKSLETLTSCWASYTKNWFRKRVTLSPTLRTVINVETFTGTDFTLRLKKKKIKNNPALDVIAGLWISDGHLFDWNHGFLFLIDKMSAHPYKCDTRSSVFRRYSSIGISIMRAKQWRKYSGLVVTSL